MDSKTLPASFYRRDNVVRISRELIGKVLCTRIGEAPVTAGMIVETEAYCGRNDKACHANDGLRTRRTETMYRAGGIAYIYLCYGIHHLFNVVTNAEERADAVLIRAIDPVQGHETIARRRGMDSSSPALTSGPGRLTQALGITTALDGAELTGPPIWIEDSRRPINPAHIASSERIGVEYAGDHARRLWRFTLEGNPWVSK